MNISFITTVLNEEKSLPSFLDSLLQQSQLPDEIIIVDGGSTDTTLEILKNYEKKFLERGSNSKKITYSIITKKGNRPIGRNTAIKAAQNEIITCSDVGCILDPQWLERIIAPFINSVNTPAVVAGYYLPAASNESMTTFQTCLATYTCVMPDHLDPDIFLPSSRSIAFTKTVWQKVGGYPEHLDTCEDLVFAKILKNSGDRFFLQKDALVYWPQKKNLIEAFTQFFNYATGDGRARYIRSQTPFLFLRYIVALALLVLGLWKVIALLFAFYLLWAIQKNYRYVNRPQALIYLPLLQLAADIAVMSGMIYGFLTTKNIKKHEN